MNKLALTVAAAAALWTAGPAAAQETASADPAPTPSATTAPV
jgi:hypothetical protein